MRLVFPHRLRRCRIVFQKHQIPEEWLHWCLEGPLLVRAPEIVRIADRLFDTIVEIVAVGRPGVRFDLDAGDQISVGDGEKIPALGRAALTRQVGIYLPGKYFGIGNARIFQKIPDYPEKTVKLLSSGHFGPSSLIAPFAAAPAGA